MKFTFDKWELDIVPTILVCVLAPLLLYFSYWLFITGIIGAIRMIKSKIWVETIGRIINIEIVFKEFRGDESIDFQFVTKKTYQYFIDGIMYESSQTFASDSLFHKDYKALDKFPKYKYWKNYILATIIEL